MGLFLQAHLISVLGKLMMILLHYWKDLRAGVIVMPNNRRAINEM